ncbi:hypothetical protein H0H93_012083, partial [Arthromyces matolae]
DPAHASGSSPPPPPPPPPSPPPYSPLALPPTGSAHHQPEMDESDHHDQMTPAHWQEVALAHLRPHYLSTPPGAHQHPDQNKSPMPMTPALWNEVAIAHMLPVDHPLQRPQTLALAPSTLASGNHDTLLGASSIGGAQHQHQHQHQQQQQSQQQSQHQPQLQPPPQLHPETNFMVEDSEGRRQAKEKQRMQ